jgi:hypothetical protein
MRVRLARLAALALAMAVALGAADLAAEDAVPIRFQAVVDSASLLRAWDSAVIEDIEAELGARWGGRLARRYRHWDLVQDAPVFYGTVTLRISEPESNKVFIGMDWTPRDGARAETIWTKLWLGPGDFMAGARPPASQAKAVLRDKTSEMFGDAEATRLFEVLREVPLGARGRWARGDEAEPLRAVTSLPWDRFGRLAQSIVEVLCMRSGAAGVPVKGEVLTEPSAFQGDEAAGTYEALVVDPIEDDDGSIAGEPPEAVASLPIGPIFLVEERTGVDLEFFDLFAER